MPAAAAMLRCLPLAWAASSSTRVPLGTIIRAAAGNGVGARERGGAARAVGWIVAGVAFREQPDELGGPGGQASRRIIQRLQGSGAGHWDLDAALCSLDFQAGQSIGALTLAQSARSTQALGRHLACRGSLGDAAQQHCCCCGHHQKTNGRSHGVRLNGRFCLFRTSGVGLRVWEQTRLNDDTLYVCTRE